MNNTLLEINNIYFIFLMMAAAVPVGFFAGFFGIGGGLISVPFLFFVFEAFNVDKDFTTIGFADIVPGLQKTADRLVDISYKTRNIKGRTDEGGIKIDVLIDSGFVKKKRGSAFNKIKKFRNK